MTAKEHAFALRILAGDPPSKAYLNAGYSGDTNANVIAVAANRILNRPHVQELVTTGRQAKLDKALLTRDEKRKILRDIAKGKAAKMGDRIRAVQVDNEMTGDNAPQQVNVFGLSDLLMLVRKKAE
jgi:phage terminase small subunit